MNAIKEWFTMKKKMLISAILVLTGVAFSLFGPREGVLGYVEYMLYVSGLAGFTNMLFSKVTKCNMFFPVSIVASLAGVAVCVALLQVNAEDIGTSTVAAFICAAAVVLWVINSLLMKGVSFAKRAVSGFFCTVMNGVSMAVVLFIVALLRWK